SPVTPAPGPFGNVTLSGSGQFVGGFLGGTTGTLTVTGRIKPWVPVAVPYVITLFWNEAQDEVLSAGLVPEFFVSRAGGRRPKHHADFLGEPPVPGLRRHGRSRYRRLDECDRH